MKLLRRGQKYQYLEDGIFDSRVPVRSDEEFRTGIRFMVKLIGVSVIPKPRSRNDIVTAMRTIRADCRGRKVNKIPAELQVSFDGIRIMGKKKNCNFSTVTHPLNRIFYVSHDSLDLHVFSLIVRDDALFKCVVFKASKKILAVNAVRTIGQAFELCHKMREGSGEKSAEKRNDLLTPPIINIIEPHLKSQQAPTDESYGVRDDDEKRSMSESSGECSDVGVKTSDNDDTDLGNDLRALMSSLSNKLDNMTERICQLEQQITRISLTVPPEESADGLASSQTVTSDCDEFLKLISNILPPGELKNLKQQMNALLTRSSAKISTNRIMTPSDIDNQLNEKLSSSFDESKISSNHKLTLEPESLLCSKNHSSISPILPASKLLYLGELY